MAKKAISESGFIIDRLLMIGALLAATAYIVRGSWATPFLEAAAIMIGTVWAYRAIQTNPSREFRLAALLVAVLLWVLLSFYLGSAHGLLPAVPAN